MGMSLTLTPIRLAGDKEWEKVCRILLEDLEDLQRGGRRLELVLGMAGGQAEATKLAMRRCKEKYFSELAYKGKTRL
jgi:hypothetical protein